MACHPAAAEPLPCRPIFDALEGVGEGCAFEPFRIVEHVGDGAAGKIIIVEWQHYARQQDAGALAFDRRPGAGRIHTARNKLFRSFGDEAFLCLGRGWRQRGALFGQ